VKRIACLFALLPTLLVADWKIVTQTGGDTITEYVKASLRRTDPSPAYSTVLDFDHRRQLNWRNDLRQYELVEWPRERQFEPASRVVITIERNTTDTGDRKQFFGRPARRLVTRTKRSDSPESESVTDAWYIDVQPLPNIKRAAGGSFAVLTVSVAGETPRIEVKQTGPAPEGLAVWQKTTTTVMLPGHSRQSFESLSQVTELVEGALPDKLFQPPDGYHRVTNLSYPASRPAPHTLADLVRAHWQMIENWFSARF
jgi:hypothetical protein